VNRPDWTSGAALPGGDFSKWVSITDRPDQGFEQFVAALVAEFPELSAGLIRRWVRSYGALVEEFLARGRPLGEELAPGIFEAELRNLRNREWALTLEDVLWRRSKLGLHLPPGAAARLSQWWDAENQRTVPRT